MRATLYVIACLVIPAVWGLIASWALDRIAERRKASDSREDAGEMYYI